MATRRLVHRSTLCSRGRACAPGTAVRSGHQETRCAGQAWRPDGSRRRPGRRRRHRQGQLRDRPLPGGRAQVGRPLPGAREEELLQRVARSPRRARVRRPVGRQEDARHDQARVLGPWPRRWKRQAGRRGGILEEDSDDARRPRHGPFRRRQGGRQPESSCSSAIGRTWPGSTRSSVASSPEWTW